MEGPSREAQLIALAAAAAGAARPGVIVGIGDDGAVLDGGLVLTTDTLIEGVHWDDRLSPEDVAWKAVAANVSDLGAMGATPVWATLNLSLPHPLDLAWATAFFRGLGEALAWAGLALVGGDTTRAPVRVVALTLGGQAARPLLRSGGRPGHLLAVTGALGLAAEGFFSSRPSPEANAWFRRPKPPFQLGPKLAGLASAAMDLSDGLATDLPRFAAAAGCGARVYATLLPGRAPVEWKVSFGEDYQLLLAVPPEHQTEVEAITAMDHIRLSWIGALTEEREVCLEGGPGPERGWPAALFTHFPEGRCSSS